MADDVARLRTALADRYRIERELGQGGMATVYLAHDLKHDREVAIKVLRPELAAVIGAERFLAEIKTTANLQHPHILPLHDSGEVDGMLFYVMPYVEGVSLRDRISHEHQLPVPDAVRIASEVADALQYAHEHGVIHRDIKPENILLQGGHALVADFGIALAVSTAGTRMTETGMSLGTPHYMSPEQAMGEKQIDARSDVYALGAVLYEMLTGDPPFTGSTVQAVVAKVMSAEAEPVTMVRKTTPPAVAAAVHRALEKLPADRFASAAEFAAALVGTPGPGPTLGHRGLPGAVAPRARLTALALWAVAVVAAVAVVGWVWHRPSSGGTSLLHVELQAPVGTEFSEHRFAALSPDGMRLAFVGLRPTGGRVLWIRDLRTGRTDSLHESDGAESPFWSPDGTALGYYAHGSIWRIQDDGTAPQSLCSTTDPGGSWNRAGVILFTRNGRPFTVDAGGGACTPVGGAWADTSLYVGRPAWLPDGRHFAATSPVNASIVLSDASGAAPRTWIPKAGDVQFVGPNLAVFTIQTMIGGAGVFAQRFDPGSLKLQGTRTTLVARVRAASGVPSYTVVSSALAYLVPSRGDAGPAIVDPDGALKDSVGIMGTWTFRHAHGHPWLALGGFGLWRYDLDRKTAVPMLPPAPQGGHLFVFPVWSPGDSVLAVAAEPCGLLLVRPAANSDTAVVPTLASCPKPSDWTADGRFIVMTMAPDSAANRGEIWSYEVATGKQQKLVSVNGAASSGVVSPDERWLAYVSDETGRLQVYVRPFRRAGSPVAVSPQGGATPRWGADGRALYYITPDGRVVRVPVTPGADLKLGSPKTLFRAPRWSMRLYADQQRGQQLTTPYDVSPDGKQFYLRQSVEVTPDATLVLGWQALLGGSSGADAQRHQ